MTIFINPLMHPSSIHLHVQQRLNAPTSKLQEKIFKIIKETMPKKSFQPKTRTFCNFKPFFIFTH